MMSANRQCMITPQRINALKLHGTRHWTRPQEIHLLDSSEKSVHPFHVLATDEGIFESGVTQIGINKDRAGDDGIHEFGALQVCLGEVHAIHDGICQIGTFRPKTRMSAFRFAVGHHGQVASSFFDDNRNNVLSMEGV